MDLADQLAAVRTQIRQLRVGMTRPTYSGWAWEHRHNMEAALRAARRWETELLDRLAAEEARTSELIAAATTSGNPLLFAVAYVTVGITLAA